LVDWQRHQGAMGFAALNPSYKRLSNHEKF
jgi:hypothetical protein